MQRLKKSNPVVITMSSVLSIVQSLLKTIKVSVSAGIAVDAIVDILFSDCRMRQQIFHKL